LKKITLYGNVRKLGNTKRGRRRGYASAKGLIIAYKIICCVVQGFTLQKMFAHSQNIASDMHYLAAQVIFVKNYKLPTMKHLM
jgi:hypothetical protein